MRFTRFGHSAVLVEHEGTRVLIDPGVWSRPETFDLTELDAIVVTHQHPDHLDPDRATGLIASNPHALLLCDPETASLRPEDWSVNAHDLVTTVKTLSIVGVGEWHADIWPALPQLANVGVVISDTLGQRFFHPGDSYASVPADVDVLALPLIAPWAKIAETLDFARNVGPKHLFAIHDVGVSERAAPIYWGHVRNFTGVENIYELSPTDTLSLEQ